MAVVPGAVVPDVAAEPDEAEPDEAVPDEAVPVPDAAVPVPDAAPLNSRLKSLGDFSPCDPHPSQSRNALEFRFTLSVLVPLNSVKVAKRFYRLSRIRSAKSNRDLTKVARLRFKESPEALSLPYVIMFGVLTLI